MKHTKYLALLLVLAMLCSLLAACGSSSSSSSDETTETEETTEETTEAEETTETADEAEEEAEEAEETEEEAEEAAEEAEEEAALDPAVGYDLPLFDPDENVTFTMWVSFSDIGGDFMPDGYASNYAYLESVEMTGVTIDMTQVSTDTNTELFNIMIASGDYVDIVTNVSQVWTSSYETAVEEDIFMDLTDLTHNYMPYYMLAYESLDDDTKRDLVTDSGYMAKLISINTAEPDGATEGAFIRTDLLEAVGLDIPETYDDLYEVLEAFQVYGLSEPLMLVSGITHTSNALASGYDVSAMFGTSPSVSEPWYVVDGEVKYGIVEDGYKEYMQMLVDFYEAGYVNPDFVTDNSNPMGSDFMATAASDEVGIFFGETNLIPNYYELATNEDYEIYPLAPITKEEGDTTHFGTYKSAISGRLATISITTAAAGKEEQLGKYLDFFFTEEGARLSSMGVEGNEDGSYVFDENGDMQYSDYWYELDLTENQKPTLFIYSVMPMLKPETPSSYTMDLQFLCEDVWDEDADDDYRLPDYLTMTADETDEYNIVYSDIQTMIEENLLKFVMGDRSMDEWDDFVQDIWDMGLQTCIDIKQDTYDRYLERTIS